MRYSIPFHRSSLMPIEKEYLRKDFENIMESGRFTEGIYTEVLEQLIKTISGFEYALAFSSCTATLFCAIRAINSIHGACNQVITTPMTWTATHNAIEMAGGCPHYVDVNANGLMASFIVPRISADRVAAVVPVTLYGQSIDILQDHQAPIVLDAAHSINQLDQMNQTLDIACFSLHPTKLFFAGEGGFAITNNLHYYKTMKRLRWQGMERGSLHHYEKSLKFVMPEFSAACAYRTLGNFSLRRKELKEIVATYNDEFSEVHCNILRPLGNLDVSMITIRVNEDERDNLIDYLGEYGVEAKVKYPSDANFFVYPSTNKFQKEIITLPCYRTMVPEAIAKVVSMISIYHEKIGSLERKET